MFDYNDLLNAIDGEDFSERPVDIEEFIASPDYLNMNARLSNHQLTLVRASTQIYKESTLIALYGEDEGRKRYANTFNEVIFQLGKGSGKDFTSTVAVAYIVYLLLCLKDPAVYYGQESGDHIDILNIAINADQARNVFFNGFKSRIEKSPWFAGKFDPKQSSIEFNKDVRVFSGHSEREAWEGYNTFYVVLDEIAGFALDSNTGNMNAKTAEAIYKMYNGSVTSRYPDFGKLVLLSFPRYKDDFIQQRYNDVIADKEVIIRKHTFKLNPDLPDGTEGNEFEVEWEEDHIISYNVPRVFALKRPSWDVNPNRTIADYTRAFYDDMVDSLMRFACMPPLAIDGFFKDADRIDEALAGTNGVDADSGQFRQGWTPDDSKRYFIHVDLAKKHDRCVVSMAHVEKWETRDIGGKMTEPAPVIKVDAIRYWTPSVDKNVDFADVREYIVSLRRKGFNIRLVTFDRWESDDMIQYLNSVGMRAEKLSVGMPHYTDLAMTIGERRVTIPKNEILRKELLQLRIMPNGKLDHPRSGSKDIADSVCGAVYNAIAHTPRGLDQEIEIKTADDLRRENMDAAEREAELMRERGPAFNTFTTGPIKPPTQATEPMPSDLADFMQRISVI